MGSWRQSAVVMKGCECGGRFEHVDDIVVDMVVDGARVVVRHLHGLRCTRCGIAALESRIDAHG